MHKSILNLVTGATGILGSHVVLTLLQNNEFVIACKQKNSDIQKTKKLFSYYTSDYENLFQKIKWVNVDFSDIFSIEEALAGVTHVYHCAGLVSFNKSDRKKLIASNEKATRNIVNACLLKNIQAFCHVSSISTINNLDYKLALNEDVFWKTSGKESDYAWSKYNAEKEVWRGIEEGLNAVIVNPGVILSPGFWNQSSSRLFETNFKDNKFYTDGGAGYVAATDVAKIMVALVSKKLFGNRYILIENNYSFQYVFTKIKFYFNKPVPSINAPKILLKVARFLERIIVIFTRKESKLSSALINAAFNKQEYSNEKIKTALNYKFEPLEHTIKGICTNYVEDKVKT